MTTDFSIGAPTAGLQAPSADPHARLSVTADGELRAAADADGLVTTPAPMLPEEISGGLSRIDHETGAVESVVKEPGEVAPPAPTISTVLTERQRAIAAARRLLLVNALPYLEHGCALNHTAAAIHVPTSRLWRVMALAPDNLLLDSQRAGWLLDQPLHVLAPAEIPGRRSPWVLLVTLPAVVRRLQELYQCTIGASSEYMAAGVRTGSASLTLLRFADDPLCPPELAQQLRRGSQPKPLLNVIRAITPELEAKLRGSKHYGHAGPVNRRSMTVINADGTSAHLQPGDAWELDDMSMNQPFWCDGPDGPILSRQGLYCRDVASRQWVGVDLIARPREAYRAEDILRTLRRLMQAHGKPRRALRLERGVWAARSLRGFCVDAAGRVQEDVAERPAMEDGERQLLQDGLRALGIDIVYCYSSRGKGGIESAFNYLQSVTATFAGPAVNVGRHAGEFERAAKRLRQARAEVHTPAALGFLHIDAAADLQDTAMRWINEHAKTGVVSHPSSVLRHLSPQDLACFLPDCRELEICGGRVTATLDGQPYDFRAPESFAALGSGFRVSMRWDPSEPTLGAAIYSRETSSANWAGYQLGQFIGWADYEAAGPQFDFRPADQREGSDLRRRQVAFHRTAFRAMGRPELPRIAIAAVRDGRGNVGEVRTGGPMTEDRGRRTADSPSVIRHPSSVVSAPTGGFRLRQIAAELAEDFA